MERVGGFAVPHRVSGLGVLAEHQSLSLVPGDELGKGSESMVADACDPFRVTSRERGLVPGASEAEFRPSQLDLQALGASWRRLLSFSVPQSIPVALTFRVGTWLVENPEAVRSGEQLGPWWAKRESDRLEPNLGSVM